MASKRTFWGPSLSSSSKNWLQISGRFRK